MIDYEWKTMIHETCFKNNTVIHTLPHTDRTKTESLQRRNKKPHVDLKPVGPCRW